eukprot:3187388-Alexandrium_andersonii.AAC.1
MAGHARERGATAGPRMWKRLPWQAALVCAALGAALAVRVGKQHQRWQCLLGALGPGSALVLAVAR